MRFAAAGAFLFAVVASSIACADGPVTPAPPPKADAPAEVELTDALLKDLSVVLDRRGRAVDSKRLDPAWFRDLSITADRFDAIYDEVARAQHANAALDRLAESRKVIERFLVVLEERGASAAEKKDGERQVADVKAEASAIAPPSDVVKRNRETMRGRSSFPLLELRVSLMAPKPGKVIENPGWPFVDPSAKPTAAKPPADRPPSELRKPLVRLTDADLAEYLRLRTRMNEAKRAQPDPSWLETGALDSKRYPDVDAEVRFQLRVLVSREPRRKEREALQKTMDEIEPLLLSSSGPAYKGIADHYFGLNEQIKASQRREEELEATTPDGHANR